ncbi:hypothetical protein [Micromonospora zamorensis]|uniref:hypothetical protein n=1 Tax=Micromonospora zamorensis TaxID=709883 RepID=UPI002ED16C7A|nr:hypothetical protein OG886_07205 [Micromonospora zamorensis]
MADRARPILRNLKAEDLPWRAPQDLQKLAREDSERESGPVIRNFRPEHPTGRIIQRNSDLLFEIAQRVAAAPHFGNGQEQERVREIIALARPNPDEIAIAVGALLPVITPRKLFEECRRGRSAPSMSSVYIGLPLLVGGILRSRVRRVSGSAVPNAADSQLAGVRILQLCETGSRYSITLTEVVSKEAAVFVQNSFVFCLGLLAGYSHYPVIANGALLK